MELKPQVILMDLRIPEFEDGMRLLTHLRENVPESRLLALTSPGLDANLVYRAIHSGAIGCVLKSDSDIDEVITAIRNVANGQVFLSAAALDSLVQSITQGRDPPQFGTPQSLDGLSPREYDVLDLVAQGLSNSQIAETLVIAESTVRSHLQHILDKLQLKNRVQAAAYAMRTRRPTPPMTMVRVEKQFERNR
jgi:DNA-binding NarL/FixJ family response regulator